MMKKKKTTTTTTSPPMKITKEMKMKVTLLGGKVERGPPGCEIEVVAATLTTSRHLLHHALPPTESGQRPVYSSLTKAGSMQILTLREGD
jgi:hypothetical protein